VIKNLKDTAVSYNCSKRFRSVINTVCSLLR